MNKSKKILIGGRQFTVKPFKLGQLRGVIEALEEMQGKSGGALIEAGCAILVAGLKPSHPDLTIEALLEIEGTMQDLNEAIASVLAMAGLRQTGEMMPQPEAI